MTITAIPNTPIAGKLTIRMEFVGDTAKIKARANTAAQNLFDFRNQGDHGVNEFGEQTVFWDDLSDQDKLDLVNDYVKLVLNGLSLEHYQKTGAVTGQTTGESDYATETELEDA